MKQHFLFPSLLTFFLATGAHGQGSDTCATPSAISGAGPFLFDTTTATTGAEGQTAGLCSFTGGPGIEHDVWFSWIAPTTGHATLSLCGLTSVNAKAAVYAGAGCGTAAIQGCADDTCASQPQLEFLAFDSHVYLIQIGSAPGSSSGSGSFALTVAPGLWDRTVEAPVITSGSSAGLYNVRVDTGVAITGDLPGGSSIAATISLYVNGNSSAPGGPVDPGPWNPSPGNQCSAAGCSGCGMSWGPSLIFSVCESDWGWCWTPPPPPGYNSCSCVKRDLSHFIWTDVALNFGDTLFARLDAAPGSLAEDQSCNDQSASTIFSDAGTPYCFGDGTGSACPCGNNGVAGNGCANSLSASGAQLTAAGTATISADSLVLTATGMPNSSCLYFQGTSQQNGGLGIAFGDGLRCAGGSIIRLGTKSNAGGGSSYPVGGDQPISVRGLNAPGSVRTYQAWYRNAAVFCTASTFNLTNGLSISWGA
jgi:hypothetical protein